MTPDTPAADAPDAAASVPDRAVRLAAMGRRALRFEQALADRLATRVDRTPYGVARFSPDLPLVWSLNTVEVTRPVAVSELLVDVETRFDAHGLAHRCVTTSVPEVAWVLAPALHDRGWALDRLVVMVHDGLTAPTASPLGIGPVDLGTWAAHAAAVRAEEPWGSDPAVRADMARRDARIDERVDVTWVVSADGSAGCEVLRHGAVAQIEDVVVRAEARGRGLGVGLMAAAMRAAGPASLVFLVADADDWPRGWYARLGFEPAVSAWSWVRRPDLSR